MQEPLPDRLGTLYGRTWIPSQHVRFVVASAERRILYRLDLWLKRYFMVATAYWEKLLESNPWPFLP